MNNFKFNIDCQTSNIVSILGNYGLFSYTSATLHFSNTIPNLIVENQTDRIHRFYDPIGYQTILVYIDNKTLSTLNIADMSQHIIRYTTLLYTIKNKSHSMYKIGDHNEIYSLADLHPKTPSPGPNILLQSPTQTQKEFENIYHGIFYGHIFMPTNMKNIFKLEPPPQIDHTTLSIETICSYLDLYSTHLAQYLTRLPSNNTLPIFVAFPLESLFKHTNTDNIINLVDNNTVKIVSHFIRNIVALNNYNIVVTDFMLQKDFPIEINLIKAANTLNNLLWLTTTELKLGFLPLSHILPNVTSTNVVHRL